LLHCSPVRGYVWWSVAIITGYYANLARSIKLIPIYIVTYILIPIYYAVDKLLWGRPITCTQVAIDYASYSTYRCAYVLLCSR